jgi:hypothetical protein
VAGKICLISLYELKGIESKLSLNPYVSKEAESNLNPNPNPNQGFLILFGLNQNYHKLQKLKIEYILKDSEMLFLAKLFYNLETPSNKEFCSYLN